MTTSDFEIERSWAAWRLGRNRRGLKVGLLFMVTLYPAFGLLDWALAPPSALPWLWGTRAGIASLAMVLLLLMRSPRFDRWVDAVAVLCGWLAGAGISIMTAYMGGLASPYYAGLILVVLAAGLLFVWPPVLVFVTLLGLVASFPLVNLALGAGGDLHVAASNMTFLSATALIAGVAQVLQFTTLREQHEQRLRLEVTSHNLERAHTKLQQLDEFKSRFFANMTHELRTPLAMVVTPLELMMQGEMGAFSEPQRSSLATMYRSALKLLKLINDLLDLSRLEESRLRIDVKEQDLAAQLRGLVEQTDVLARRKLITLSFSSGDRPCTVWCDAERLERVFVNLLSNAIKFTPVNGHVTVELREQPDDVEVVVTDDGPGFPPDRAEQIFERFYQVDMADRRAHGGTGIGLALARELVMLHGGSIRAESDGRTGARFTVKLPKGRGHFRPEALAEPRDRRGGVAGRARPRLGGPARGPLRVPAARHRGGHRAARRRAGHRRGGPPVHGGGGRGPPPHHPARAHVAAAPVQGADRPGRAEGARPRPPRAPEPGGHRPHDAGHRRPGAHPQASRGAVHPPHPHHHAHGAGGARRPCEGARDGGQRLPHQALLAEGASHRGAGAGQGEGADRRPGADPAHGVARDGGGRPGPRDQQPAQLPQERAGAGPARRREGAGAVR